MDYEVKYFLRKWFSTYSKFIINLSLIGVFIASAIVQPCDAALYLMTMNEATKFNFV